MKKNVMMRIASVLLIAVLISTCGISGTYAKYVTTASGSESARVAKWGVEVGVTGFDNVNDGLFSKTYAADSTTTITNTVVSTAKVVAPGTKNENGVSFSLKGKPEVAVKIEFVVKSSTGDEAIDVMIPAGEYKDWTQAPYTGTFKLNDVYKPLVFTLKSGSVTLKTGTLAEIETFLEGKTSEWPAGTDLSKIMGNDCTGDYVLTWAWAFGDPTGITGNDKADTLLGNLADGNQSAIADASTGVDLAISITATQID